MKKTLVYIAIGFFLLVVATFVSQLILKNINSSQNSKTNLSPPPSNYKRADINQDGVVDATDAEIVRENIGCSKTKSCWNKVVDYTLSGHNPIYASDLDLNGDGVISQADVDLVK